MKAATQILVALLLALLALDAQAAGLDVNAGGNPRLDHKAGANPGPHAALYSFSDVYRLTVGGAALDESSLAVAPAFELTPVAQPAPEFQSHASAQSPAPGYQFSIVAVPKPQSGLLLLSGLALMVWVARRRLLQSL